jgi:hypothetical protein
MNEGKVNLIKPKSLSKQNKNHRRSRKSITHHKIENEEGWKKWEERKENKLTSIKKMVLCDDGRIIYNILDCHWVFWNVVWIMFWIVIRKCVQFEGKIIARKWMWKKI